MRRLLNDRRYFAKPTKALFSELRGHFPISEQLFVFQVVDRNVKLALRYLDQAPADELALIVERECKAHTRRGTPCQREPLPGRDYCPSHKHLEEDVMVESHQLERRGGAPARRVATSGGARGPAVIGGVLLGVDVGGTFTDAVLVDGDRIHTAKSPTTPGDQSAGVIAAIEAVLGHAGAPASAVSHFAHGMTVGTNALLERRGAQTTLIATAGFTDLLEIARQDRPSLYRLCDDRPAPLAPVELRVAAGERIGPDGIVEDLTEREVERITAEIERLDPEAVAICLLFSFLDPAHERRLAEAIRERFPELHVSVSSEVLPQFREYERCATTVLDAYLSPLLSGYLGRLARALRRRRRPRTADHALLGRGGELGRGGGRGRLERPQRAGGRGRRGRASWPWPAGTATRSGSTWVGHPATSAWSQGEASAAPTGVNSTVARSSCRWSTSTRSAPAAGRSPGATAAAPSGSARARRAPSRGPRATAGAAPSRP